jgi:UDP-N-acetylmuramoylalanine--D-glutamate ligase
MRRVAEFFEFTSYDFKPAQKQAFFHYKMVFTNGNELTFTETLFLPKVPHLKNIPDGLMEHLLLSLHIGLGISYYKTFTPKNIRIKPLSRSVAEFWTTVYRKGLGEFWYRNNLDPAQSPSFPIDKNITDESWKISRKDRGLVGIGGGKESIVLAEMFKENNYPITSFEIEMHQKSSLVDSVMKQVGAPKLKIRRMLDEQLFDKNLAIYNGHIPISMIYGLLGVFCAVLYDYAYVVVGNARSSDYGNLRHKGEEVNHQWSKTEEFEMLFQKYVREFVTPDITYFSPLRAFYEIRVIKMFTKYEQYFPYFSSCNRNFKVYQDGKPKRWCGECPKCAYVYLLLAGFLPKEKLLAIFEQDLLAKEELVPLYKDILGFGIMKPFDCVGRFEESQAGLYLASKKYPNAAVVRELLSLIKNPEKLVQLCMQIQDAPYTPARFRFLGMKKILILGYGKEGQATHIYLQRKSPQATIEIADKKTHPENYEKQEFFDIAVKTPGIPAREAKVPYTSATNIFLSEVRNTIIGVTGSKGKSTTSSLIYAMLKQGKKPVRLLGNIGVPMLGELESIKKNEILVLELSSYQLEDISFSPHIAVVTNLFPDHMDYHGGFEAYYAAKHNILKFQTSQDYFIYNQHNKQLREWALQTMAKAIPFIEDFEMPEKLPLLGDHNKDNIRAAVTVAELLGVNREAILKAIKKFKPLPHRLEHVGIFSGIDFYDDAISTTPESTIAALRAIPRVETILLGGTDRGYDFTQLEKELHAQGVKNIVLFPESGKKILSSREGFTNILETSSMQEAVEFCYKCTSSSKVCLLSTASPSYSIWKNFEEKGDEFQNWVKQLGDKKY